MGVGLHADEAPENRASAIVERVLVKEIARGVRRYVVLQCAGIEFLLVVGDCDSEQITSAALAYEPAQTFKTRIPRPDMQIQAHRRSTVIYHSRVHLQRDDIFCPVLGADIGHFRTGPGYQNVHSARKSTRML